MTTMVAAAKIVSLVQLRPKVMAFTVPVVLLDLRVIRRRMRSCTSSLTRSCEQR